MAAPAEARSSPITIAARGPCRPRRRTTGDKDEKKDKPKGIFSGMAGNKDKGNWDCIASFVFDGDRLVRVNFAHKDVDSPYAWQKIKDPEKAEREAQGAGADLLLLSAQLPALSAIRYFSLFDALPLRHLSAFDALSLRYLSAGGRVADGLDIVAVGVEHEGAVVIRVIMRAKARRSVVLAARGNRGRIEGIDLRRGYAAAKATWTWSSPKVGASPIQKKGLPAEPKPTAAPLPVSSAETSITMAMPSGASAFR